MKLTLFAPDGGRPAGPVASYLPLDRYDVARMLGLVNLETDCARPVQIDARGRLCWWEDAMADGETRHYHLADDHDLEEVTYHHVYLDTGPKAHVYQNDRLLSTYHGSAELDRPFLYPLNAPDGSSATIDVAESSDDHPHHRSCWTGWGDVNGVDHWSGAAGHGVQRHRRFATIISGPVFARIGAVIDWLDGSGNRQFVELRVFTFYGVRDGEAMIDAAIRFGLSEGDVRFGDTTKGGLLALRLAPSLSVDGGGEIVDAEGNLNEDGCWGNAADSCTCVGSLSGRPAGVTVMDHPSNSRHPTHWNARNYGLIAANPFGLAEFLHNTSLEGGRTWQRNDSLMFRYRMILHSNKPATRDLKLQYSAFAKPVHVELGF